MNPVEWIIAILLAISLVCAVIEGKKLSRRGKRCQYGCGALGFETVRKETDFHGELADWRVRCRRCGWVQRVPGFGRIAR